MVHPPSSMSLRNSMDAFRAVTTGSSSCSSRASSEQTSDGSTAAQPTPQLAFAMGERYHPRSGGGGDNRASISGGPSNSSSHTLDSGVRYPYHASELVQVSRCNVMRCRVSTLILYSPLSMSWKSVVCKTSGSVLSTSAASMPPCMPPTALNETSMTSCKDGPGLRRAWA